MRAIRTRNMRTRTTKKASFSSVQFNILLHAGIGSDDIGDWSSADGALESLCLEFQPTLHADTHVSTPVHDRGYAGL